MTARILPFVKPTKADKHEILYKCLDGLLWGLIVLCGVLVVGIGKLMWLSVGN